MGFAAGITGACQGNSDLSATGIELNSSLTEQQRQGVSQGFTTGFVYARDPSIEFDGDAWNAAF